MYLTGIWGSAGKKVGLELVSGNPFHLANHICHFDQVDLFSQPDVSCTRLVKFFRGLSVKHWRLTDRTAANGYWPTCLSIPVK